MALPAGGREHKLRPPMVTTIILSVLLLILLNPSDAQAWGPATHVFLSGSLLGGVAGVAPALIRFLSRFRRDFYQGSVWADVLLGKRWADRRLHSHSWEVGQALLDRSRTDGQRAFSLGYLGHLAADTIAHGHFIPRKLLLSRLTENLGHFYWELRADGLLSRRVWDEVEYRVGAVSLQNRELLEEVLKPTFFSFETNRLLFEGQLASYRLERLHALVLAVERNARLPLSGITISGYHKASLARMTRILHDPSDPLLVAIDPTGGRLMRTSVETRRNLRRLIRSGDLDEGVLFQVADRLRPGVHSNM
jgi:hypothetical protein